MIVKQLWPTTIAHFKWNDQESLGQTVNDIILKFPDGIGDDERPDIEEYNELQSAHNFIDQSMAEYLSKDFPLQQQFTFSWWVHVYRENATHHIHNHLGSQFTGILYLASPPNGGELLLHDPRGNANRGYNDNLKHIFAPEVIKPQAGDLFIFPSFVWHNVERVHDMRICMPFDVWC
jgi:predicted 2-oxoglutarate/Fe(II)-dependent dioxygenase YbiX|tara:strand:- start:5078 stop:5608 length:531 start_codon:yes stop_codon:yes gene_type:complete